VHCQELARLVGREHEQAQRRFPRVGQSRQGVFLFFVEQQVRSGEEGYNGWVFDVHGAS
jgi:hypothetical protein